MANKKVSIHMSVTMDKRLFTAFEELRNELYMTRSEFIRHLFRMYKGGS